jgi:hypothetical protein
MILLSIRLRDKDWGCLNADNSMYQKAHRRIEI